MTDNRTGFQVGAKTLQNSTQVRASIPAPKRTFAGWSHGSGVSPPSSATVSSTVSTILEPIDQKAVAEEEIESKEAGEEEGEDGDETGDGWGEPDIFNIDSELVVEAELVRFSASDRFLRLFPARVVPLCRHHAVQTGFWSRPSCAPAALRRRRMRLKRS